jgi:hypothetical protein
VASSKYIPVTYLYGIYSRKLRPGYLPGSPAEVQTHLVITVPEPCRHTGVLRDWIPGIMYKIHIRMYLSLLKFRTKVVRILMEVAFVLSP